MSCGDCRGTGYVFALPIKSESPALYSFLCTCSYSDTARARSIPRWSKSAEKLYKKTEFIFDVPAIASGPEEFTATPEDEILKNAYTSKNWSEPRFTALVKEKGKDWVKGRLATLKQNGYL